MAQRTPLTDELLAKIAGSVEQLSPRSTVRREADRLIAHLSAQLRAAQERGCTYSDIAQRITESGYPITPNALRTAVRRYSAAATPRRTKPGKEKCGRATDEAAAPASTRT